MRNRLNATETEDTVRAMLEWAENTLGSIHISTAKGGQDDRIELVGTRGVMRIGQNMEVTRFEPNVAHYSKTSPERFGQPERVPVTLEPVPSQESHLEIYRNFHEAIVEGVQLVCDGAAGRMSLELANAMILSSYTRREVELPLDRARYRELIEKFKAEQPVTH